MRPTDRWWAQAALYAHWRPRLAALDWSAAAATAMYAHESVGAPRPADDNGYAWGKRWTNWQVTAWREGIAEGTTTRHELQTDTSLHPEMVRMAL